jgi:hypothetical protein
MTHEVHFEIIAYPHGARAVVAKIAAPHVAGAVAVAKAHAKVRCEFVDVERDGDPVAVVGMTGVVA